MKIKILTLLVLCAMQSLAQEKYYTKSGSITFESSVPTFEEVKATNNKVTAIFKPETGDIAALVLVKAFRFKIALMEEHFNENYAETNKFPKAKFSGKIKNHKLKKKNEVIILGKLTFHGVTQQIEIPASIKKHNKSIQITASFSLKPEDFGVHIPKIVRNKIAEKVDIILSFTLNKK